MDNIELKELISQIQNKDMTNFNSLYKIFSKLIFCYSLKLQSDDAESELNLFLIEILYSVNLQKFKSDNSDGLKRYIAVSLRNQYIYLSKKYKKYEISNNELNENMASYNYATDISIDLKTALELLTEKQKAVIVYRYVYEYTTNEICEKLNISRQAINGLRNRAISILKEFYGISS